MILNLSKHNSGIQSLIPLSRYGTVLEVAETKIPKFGRVRQVPIRELGWKFPGWDFSHFAKFGIFMGIL